MNEVKQIKRYITIAAMLLSINFSYCQLPKSAFVEFGGLKKNTLVYFQNYTTDIVRPGESINMVFYFTPQFTELGSRKGSTATEMQKPKPEYSKPIVNKYYEYQKNYYGEWDVSYKDGNRIFNRSFLDIFDIDSGRLFIVRDNQSKFGIIKKDGSTVVPYIYRFIDPAFGMTKFLLAYKESGVKDVIDYNGKVLYSGIFKNDDNLYKTNEGKIGLFTRNFLMLPVYDEIQPYIINQNEVQLCSFKYNNQKGIVLKDTVFYPINFNNFFIDKDRIVIENDSKKLIYDQSLNLLFDSKCENYIINQDSTYFIYKENIWHWVDYLGKEMSNVKIEGTPYLMRKSSIFGSIYFYENNKQKVYFNKKNTIPDLTAYKDVVFAESKLSYIAKTHENKFHILNRYFKNVIQKEFDNLIFNGVNLSMLKGNQLFSVDTFGNQTLINTSFNYIDTKEVLSNSISKIENLAFYKKGNKYGLQYKGKWTEPFIDYIIESKKNNEGKSFSPKIIFIANNLMGMLLDDTLLYPSKYFSFEEVNNMIVAKKSLQLFDVLDKKGKVILEDLSAPKAKNHGIKNGKDLFFSEDNKGNLIVRNDLTFVNSFYDGPFHVSKNGKFGILEKVNFQTLNPVYSSISREFYYNGERYVIVQTDQNKFGIYNAKGFLIADPIYDKISYLENRWEIIGNGKQISFERLLKLKKYDSIFLDK